MRYLRKLAGDEKGATVVEYGLILALIFLAMMVGVMAVGTTTANMWNNVSEAVRNNA
ncbi:MAG TPA: Flp family type IVb pilin [Allosphingosinicella sp.]|nr:Flp family type IVb pilin [Allosphingosinicella sp.]